MLLFHKKVKTHNFKLLLCFSIASTHQLLLLLNECDVSHFGFTRYRIHSIILYYNNQ